MKTTNSLPARDSRGRFLPRTAAPALAPIVPAYRIGYTQEELARACDAAVSLDRANRRERAKTLWAVAVWVVAPALAVLWMVA